MSFLWRRCTRQQPAIAAALLCASLLMLVCVGVRSASDEAGTLDCSVRVPNYSAAEQQHTRMFLDAIKAAIPALTSVWTCDNFCAHKGVECTEAGLHVRLNVDDLVGSLPEIPEGVIGSSVVVTKLTFSGDISNLKGTLPVSWHQLTSLSSFVFISTGVEDTPPEMRRNSIQSRVMTDDAGFIPAAWASTAQRASSLPVSRVSDNNMIGSPHSAWAGASRMERNYLQKKVDERSLPEEWGNMINIKVLNLTNLSLSGTLPASWASLRLLGQLLASNNLLEGTLPASWGSLKKLLDLQLIGNKFTGIIPQEWGEMTALQRVSLQLDYCTCVPQSWITRKVEVRLYSTVLGGDCEITSDCGSSSSSELECDGPIPFYTPTQQAHTRNFLEAFKYTITDLQPLWTCTNFCVWEYVHCTPAGVAVEITGTEFFGSVPEVPADVNPSEVVVSKLDFSHSGWVEGEYPSSWALLTSLQNVSFAYTSMWGTLPSHWSSMSALKYLDLSFTWTDGRFPESWSRLANLEVLRLVHLTIPDRLPASWSSMSALRELDLDSTSTSGTLPPSWGALKNLEKLSLSNNNIDAILPAEWSSLTRLRILHLHHNQLSGSIPEIYNAMSTLTRVSLEINRFCGCLPSTWAAKNGVSMTITAQTELLAPACATENACKPETEFSSSSAPSASSSAPSSSSSAPSASSSSAPSSSSSAPSASSSSAPSSSSSAGCYGEIPYYSGTEVENTRIFLTAVRDSFPGLIPLWVCPNFCSWPGIYCARAGVVMDLSEMELHGSLPSIGDDCDPSEVVVRVIDMGSTEMSVEVSGTLPENWSGLTRLERLDLSYTGVSGTLPPGWSALSSLDYLNLGYNDLFGPLPYSWGLFFSLREVYLNDNWLSGSIPSSWMHLAGFEVMDLTNNQLDGSLPSLIVSSQRTFGAAAAESRLEWKRRS